MAKKKEIIKRRWLNKKGYHSTAISFFEASYLNETHPSISLTLSDCGRQITLDFNVSGYDYSSENNVSRLELFDGSVDNALYKVGQLRKSLDEVEEAINIAKVESRKALKKELKKRRKRKK